MYIYETFHLAKNWDVTHKAWDGIVEKPLKKSQKISF